MTVLHLISSGGMYGAEAVILQLCQEMERTGGSGQALVGVFAPERQPEPALYRAAQQAGVGAELIPCRGQLDLRVGSTLRALARRLDADILHAHGYKADVYAGLAFRGPDRPALISTCHTWYDNDLAVRLYGALDRRMLRSFDAVVAVSTEVRTRLLAAGVQPGRVHLIQNGVTVPEQTPREGTTNQLRVGLVGRLAPEKGIDIFIRAVAALGPAGDGVEFLVAGDGPDRAALEALVQSLGLTDRVRLLGQQSDMPSFYQSLDLLVSASRQEGLPMALLEGMATALPVVGTAVGEVHAVVAEGETGLLVPPGEAVPLAGAMAALLTDPSLRVRMGKAGRERIVAHFSAKRMTAEYEAVYARALATHHGNRHPAAALREIR